MSIKEKLVVGKLKKRTEKKEKRLEKDFHSQVGK